MTSMPEMHIAGMDLNLLVALDALLTERHVSRAASRLGTGQPALSRALARLRLWFDDPLLVRTRSGMTLTPRAQAIAGEVRAVLERIDSLVGGRATFDPATSQRTFRLCTAEYAQCLLFPALLARLAQVAPGVRIQVQPWSLGFPEALEQGAVDLVLTPTAGKSPAGLLGEPLVEDRFCCVLRAGHPAAKKRLTLAKFTEIPHIQVAPLGREGSVLDDLLAQKALSRHVVLRIPSFAVAPALVAGSDACATLPELFVRQAAPAGSLAVQPLPAGLRMPGFVLAQMWHERAHHDPGLAWLRGELRALAAQLPKLTSKKTVHLDFERRQRFTL